MNPASILLNYSKDLNIVSKMSGNAKDNLSSLLFYTPTLQRSAPQSAT